MQQAELDSLYSEGCRALLTYPEGQEVRYLVARPRVVDGVLCLHPAEQQDMLRYYVLEDGPEQLDNGRVLMRTKTGIEVELSTQFSKNLRPALKEIHEAQKKQSWVDVDDQRARAVK